MPSMRLCKQECIEHSHTLIPACCSVLAWLPSMCDWPDTCCSTSLQGDMFGHTLQMSPLLQSNRWWMMPAEAAERLQHSS
jgi:hypothetical protein